MIVSSTLMMSPNATEVATTAIVCLVSDFLSGQMIFLNSAFKPLNQLFLGAFSALTVVSPIVHFPFDLLLLRFFVHGVLFAESTVFLGFHSVRVILLFFCHVVISLFAIHTCQCDLYAHDFHLRLITFFAGGLRKPPSFRHKKKAYFHSPCYLTTPAGRMSSTFFIFLCFAKETQTEFHTGKSLKRFLYSVGAYP